MLVSYVRVSGCDVHLQLWTGFLLVTAVTAQGTVPLPSTWETWVEFPAPGFKQAQLQTQGSFGE